MRYCCNSESILGMPKAARERLNRLAAKHCVADGVLLAPHSARTLVKSPRKTKRTLKHAKRAQRDRFESSVDRYAKDKVYAARMDSKGLDQETVQEWDAQHMSKAREETLARLPHSLRAESMEGRQVGIADQNNSVFAIQRRTIGITRGRIPTASSATQTPSLCRPMLVGRERVADAPSARTANGATLELAWS